MLEALNNNLDFEVLIEKKKTQYKVTCPLFPQCRGFGIDKQSAIQQLCRAIGNYVGKTAAELLSLHLASDEYAEIVTDLDQRDVLDHRVFSLNTKKEKKEKKVYLRSLKKLMNDIDQNMETNLESTDLNSKKSASHANSGSENDDLMLGINLCLN